MGAATDLSGRQIKFSLYNNSDQSTPDSQVEFEIITGSVDHQTDQMLFLPVGRQVKNVIIHGHVVTYTFTGVLLIENYPWQNLTPGTEVYNLSVILNRGGTDIDPDTDDGGYDEIEHVSAVAQVANIKHSFDTSTHQVFDVTILADGSYYPPGASESI